MSTLFRDSLSTNPQLIESDALTSQLTSIQAAAARLWLNANADSLPDFEALDTLVKAYWYGLGGHNAYDDFWYKRLICDVCGDVFRFENLSVCPNCFKVYCYKDRTECECGFYPLG